MPKLWAPFGIRSPFDAYHTSLEISIRGLQIWNPCYSPFSKKHRLGPQNGSGSSGPEKLLKIVNCAETEKMKETMVEPQVE